MKEYSFDFLCNALIYLNGSGRRFEPNITLTQPCFAGSLHMFYT